MGRCRLRGSHGQRVAAETAFFSGGGGNRLPRPRYQCRYRNVASLEPITFHVPASAASLGPGYNVLAIAVGVPLFITVTARTDGAFVVERADNPTAQLEDYRHDPVLRGLREGIERFELPLKGGLSVQVEGSIPRGTGLGTVSAGYAAGLGAAIRIARKKIPHGLVLDCLVKLGGDPAHGAASLLGGLCATVPLNRPREEDAAAHQPIQMPIHDGWRLIVALPDVSIGVADSKRILPPTLAHGVAPRTAGRVIGLLHALANGDESLLRACMFDEVHVPYRRRLYQGIDSALQAALEAGAAGATVCGHGPGLLAMTTDEGRTKAIAKAMTEALSNAGRHATTMTLSVAHYGALPIQG